MSKYYCLVFCLALTAPDQAQAAAHPQPRSGAATMQVVLWGGQRTRTSYEYALLQEILAKTADRYPPYQLTINNALLGTERGRQVVADGQVANVYVSGMREDDLTRSGQIILVPAPAMKGLFGYRSAIIRKKDRRAFYQAVQTDRLKSWVIGQGNRWADVDILRANGFTVNDSGRYKNLLSMLHYNRFDMVLLGVAEAAETLATSPLQTELFIPPDVIIYYPHVMAFQVSGRYPELARRIADGLDIVKNDGTQDHLLAQFFGDAIQQIQSEHNRYIILSHPEPDFMPELDKPILAAPH